MQGDRERFGTSHTHTMSLPVRSPYTLPPPPGASGRLVSRPTPYSSQAFPPQLQHHYNFNPPSNQTGFSFHNSMLLPGSQAGGVLPPPTASSSMPLPDSPSQESSDALLAQSTMPRSQSVGSHDSPIAPSSPILQEEASEYKICSYRPLVGSSMNSVGMNAATFHNSFPCATHQATSLPMHCGVGYPSPANHQAAMCPTSLYTTPDSMCHSGSSLSLPMWNYPALPSMSFPGNTMTKLSLDTPRYKLTPERAIPLIKWFEDHKEHPYPTRHEKMLLCQSTQLTYTQVSTWFANARRRMKKANSEEEESRSNHSSSDECASQNSLDSHS